MKKTFIIATFFYTTIFMSTAPMEKPTNDPRGGGCSVSQIEEFIKSIRDCEDGRCYSLAESMELIKNYARGSKTQQFVCRFQDLPEGAVCLTTADVRFDMHDYTSKEDDGEPRGCTCGIRYIKPRYNKPISASRYRFLCPNCVIYEKSISDSSDQHLIHACNEILDYLKIYFYHWQLRLAPSNRFLEERPLAELINPEKRHGPVLEKGQSFPDEAIAVPLEEVVEMSFNVNLFFAAILLSKSDLRNILDVLEMIIMENPFDIIDHHNSRYPSSTCLIVRAFIEAWPEAMAIIKKDVTLDQMLIETEQDRDLGFSRMSSKETTDIMINTIRICSTMPLVDSKTLPESPGMRSPSKAATEPLRSSVSSDGSPSTKRLCVRIGRMLDGTLA